MYTVMRDPVTLPSSRVVVDRSTIKSHLLSDAKDPFNRVPLKLDEVVPSEWLTMDGVMLTDDHMVQILSSSSV